MNDLIDLLRILTEKEIKQLRKNFDNSKAVSKDSRLGEFLLDIISNEKMHQTNEDIRKRAIAEFGKAFIKNRSRSLFNLIEKFVFINWLDVEVNKILELKIKKELLLLDYYKSQQVQTDELASNSIANLIQKKSEAINKLLKTNQTDYLLQNFHLYSIKHFEYFTAQHSFAMEGAKRLENAIYCLDTFYIIAKLKFMCEAFVYRKKTDLNKPKEYADELIDFSNKIQAQLKVNESKHVLLEIYTLIFLATQNLTHKNLQNARRTILDNINKLNDDELSHIITLMINLITVLKRTKNVDLTKLNYEFLKYGLLRKIFLVDGKINPNTLISFSFLRIELERKRDSKIVETYFINIFNPKLREAIKKLCNAINYFIRGDFNEALKICNGRLSDNVVFKIHQKLLLIMCHYELRDFEKIETARSGLLRYARTQKKDEKLDKNFHNAIKNFCTAIKDLENVNIDKVQLMLRVKNENFIMMKNYLLQKIKEKK